MRLINQTAVRELLLQQAKLTRAHRWTRVSEQTLRDAEEALRVWVINYVRSAPSKGKTL